MWYKSKRSDGDEFVDARTTCISFEQRDAAWYDLKYTARSRYLLYVQVYSKKPPVREYSEQGDSNIGRHKASHRWCYQAQNSPYAQGWIFAFIPWSNCVIFVLIYFRIHNKLMIRSAFVMRASLCNDLPLLPCVCACVCVSARLYSPVLRRCSTGTPLAIETGEASRLHNRADPISPIVLTLCHVDVAMEIFLWLQEVWPVQENGSPAPPLLHCLWHWLRDNAHFHIHLMSDTVQVNVIMNSKMRYEHDME